MKIEETLELIRKELSKKSFFDMNLLDLMKLKKQVDTYFLDHPFESLKTKATLSKNFNSLKLYEHKENCFSIYMVDENPEFVFLNGARKIRVNYEKINEAAFLIEFKNIEIKLSQSSDDNNDEIFKVSVFIEHENTLSHYTFLKNEIKEITFNKKRDVERMVSYRFNNKQWVTADFSTSSYKNLKYLDEDKNEIGFGIVEYAISRYYYELQFFPLAFYFKGLIRGHLDYNKIEIIKKKKTKVIPFRFLSILNHLKENLPSSAFESDKVNLKNNDINLKRLNEIFDLAELKYTS